MLGLSNEDVAILRIAAKYLALRVAFNDYRMFTLSGFDLDVIQTGLWR